MRRLPLMLLAGCSLYGESKEPELAPAAADAGNEAASPDACVPTPDEAGSRMPVAPAKLSTSVATSIALIGSTLYVAHTKDTDIGVIDVSASAPAEVSFLVGVFTGPFRKMSAFDGKLWVSTEKEQAIVETSKTVSANPVIAGANTTANGGVFYPGNVAFYLYPSVDPSKLSVARFSGGTVSSFGPYALNAVDVSDGQLAYAEGVNVFRLPDTHVIQTATPLSGIGVTSDYVYYVENGQVIRANADHAETVAVEPGTGVRFAFVGDTLYYTAHRIDAMREREVLVSVKPCGGGTKLLFDQGGANISDFVVAAPHVYIASGDGIFSVDL